MIDELKASLDRAPIYGKNDEVVVAAVDKNTDKDITLGAKNGIINEASDYMEIDLEEEQTTEAYQETLNNDIVSIDNIENIHKHHKTPWRTICEVIKQEFFE